MIRAASSSIALGASAALAIASVASLALIAPAACSYPDFKFAADAAPVEHRVPCGPEGDLCEVGEVCCFDLLTPPVDVCAKPGACPSAHAELYCNDESFCAEGQLCCAQFGAGEFPDVIDCRQSCPVPKGHLMCETDADCSGGTCADMLEGYPGYRLCSP